jgi:hypothetical protein
MEKDARERYEERLAKLEAIEAAKDRRWRIREPRQGYLLHSDSTTQDFNSGMDESVRRNIERGLIKDGKIAFSGRYPRRYGLPGENTGQLKDLHPGTSAIPFQPSDWKDVRQERLAYEAEMRRSRDIIIASVLLGVPGPEDAAFAFLFARMGRGARTLGSVGDVVAPTRNAGFRIITRDAGNVVDDYTARQFAQAIADDPVAYRSYLQIRDRVGADVLLDFGTPPNSRQTGWLGTREIEVYARNNSSVRNAVATFIHESRHRSDVARGVADLLNWTKLDEYRAFRREFLFSHGWRPTRLERLQILEDIRMTPEYAPLPDGQLPAMLIGR